MRLLSSAVVLFALLTLLGWWIHRPRLVGMFPDGATTKPNTAVCLLLLACAVLASQADRPRGRAAARVLAWFAVALTAITLLEYGTGRNFGIDLLLANVPADRAGDPVGRMSPGTALDGLLSGVAMLCLDALPVLGSFLCGFASLLSLSALVGYLFDAGSLLGFPLLRSMAVRTATGFALLQVAYLLLRPAQEPTRSLLRSTRHHRIGAWFVLGSCFLPLLLGWPVAALYRHGLFDAIFGFALLVVLLIAAQTVLTVRNSQSLSDVEERRDRLEEARLRLEAENRRQYNVLVASERRAAESEAQYQVITNALPALVSYVDRELRYVRANETYEVWFGAAAADIQGKGVDQVLGPMANEVRPKLMAALAGVPQQFETAMRTLQGERTVSISHIPDVDAEGQVRGVVVQANDVTSTKRAEAALRQTEKLAAVGKLASSIAHEINNPLESVTNLLYLANIATNLEDVRRFLTTAEEELRRVSVIANQTLRFHKQSTNPVPVQASDLFHSVLAIYQPRFNGRLRLEQRHRPAAPLTCMDGEIRQVLNNLVANALDAMQGRPGRLIVRSREGTRPRTGEKGIVLTVADTGSGMSAKTQAAIFDAFFTTKGMSGTGLGLWVSKEIIDRHGGSLGLRSAQAATPEQPHGSVFRLFLPYEQAHSA